MLKQLAQIRVDFAPYSVTKGNFGGANINAVTKSGTNELKGKVYGYDTDQENVGDVLGSPVNQFSDETKGFVVGGQLLKINCSSLLVTKSLKDSHQVTHSQ